MDNLLINGDMAMDHGGNLQMVSGIKEIIQRAMIRLTVRLGTFPYNPQLGSELYRINLHQTDEFTLLAMVRDALASLQEINVSGVEKTIDYDQKILYLIVYLTIHQQDAMLELNQPLW